MIPLIPSYILTDLGCRWVIISFHACCFGIEEHLDAGGKMPPYVAISVELARVVLYHIVNTLVCMVQVVWLARDFG
jgi:hypothetical protein